MHFEQANRVAAWVNTHDDGTPQPRATVKPCRNGYFVTVRSLEVDAAGARTIAEDHCQTAADARNVLGY